MDISDIRNLCSILDIQMSENAFTFIEQSVKNGKYTYEIAVKSIEERQDQYRDHFRNRDLFKAKTDISSIKDAQSLKQYIRDLGLDVPDETMSRMVRSINEGQKRPSEIANYLRGVSYERFLQARNVPHLSEADHQHLKEALEPSQYEKYLRSLSQVSLKTGISEPTLDRLADAFFTDKAEAMHKYNNAISKAPVFQPEGDGISRYSKAIGVDLPYPKAVFLTDTRLTNDELKKTLIHASFDTFSNNPIHFFQNDF